MLYHQMFIDDERDCCNYIQSLILCENQRCPQRYLFISVIFVGQRTYRTIIFLNIYYGLTF